MAGACSEIIDDIEDLISSQDLVPKTRYSYRKDVTTRVVKKKHNDEKQEPKYICDSIIPGTQTIYIKTWDVPTIHPTASIWLASYNHLDNKMEADLWLLNSCTVKTPAEDHFRNEIEEAQKLGKFIVVAGCVPQAAPKTDFLKGLSIIGVQQIDRVIEVVEETLKGHSVRLFGDKKLNGKKMGGALLALPKIRKNPLIEIIPINTGCLNQCTYCKTKHARGNLGSYPPDEIISRAIQSFEEGVVELWLTSEDTGTYGRDIGSSLPELLWKLIDIIPNKCMMRIGMTNPPYILEHLDEMAKILSHPRVYSFLHVPVQSGSDFVLGEMKREYSRKEFELVVDTLLEKVPGISIATDIICGFPNETDEDFVETLSLCKKYKFPSLFINQFYPRPGTPAARMPKVPPATIKARTKELTAFFRSYERYSHKVGEIQDVLVTEEAFDGEHYVAHNKYYEQVLVPKKPGLLGQFIKVKILFAKKHYLISEPVHGNNLKLERSSLSKYFPILIVMICVFLRYIWIFLLRINCFLVS